MHKRNDPSQKAPVKALVLPARQFWHPGDILRRVLLAWLLAALTEYLLLSGQLRHLDQLEGLKQMSLLRMGVITGTVTVWLCALARFANTARLERWGIVGVLALYGTVNLCASFRWALLILWVLILGIATVFALFGRDPGSVPAPIATKAHWVWLTAGLTAVFFLFVSVWTVCRVRSFSSPTFDFGIFSQMFYNMKETGLPVTTLERDGPLSHFAVHVSPIYYLMLPAYWLVSIPETIQVLQAMVLASAVIPLWLLGKQYGLSGPGRTLCCSLLLLYPAFAGGTGYDIHENCFLTPLLLWLFYGIERKKHPVIWIPAVLTLMVKEDAAVYVAVVALWLTVKSLVSFDRSKLEQLLTGLGMLVLSLAWFFAVTGYLAKYGDGVMTYRYSNFMYDGSSSLITVIKAVLLEPGKALYECLDPEKLEFIGLTLLPLLGLPFLTRQYENYILLIPYILINLMSDYTYQHNIFFQYVFGSTAFLLYLSVVNLSRLPYRWLRTVLLVAAVTVSAVFFRENVVPKAIQYPEQVSQHYDRHESIRQTLDRIPAKASVAATTFYTAYLSQRETVYDVRYSSREHLLSCEYVVLGQGAQSDCRNYATGGKNNGYENLVKLLKAKGYTEFTALEGVLTVYRRETE